jgi:endonuclease-8
MPEGPSIFILKQQLEPFTGQKVIAASSDKKVINTDMLTGETIIGFKSFGKNFFICFKKFSIRIHMMMFGSYTINEQKPRKARLGLKFDDGEINFYTCIVELITQPLSELYDFSADIMSPKWSAAKALKKLQQEPKTLACDALLDQHIFAGSGNIIKNEVLFRTRIHPKSLLGDIPVKKLKEMINETSAYSFEFLKWKKAGTLKRHWEAYSQKTCPRDKVPFHKAALGKGGRSTFYCDRCMVLYK